MDQAIDWVIDKVLAVGKAIISGIKGAAGRIAAWWKQRVEFEGDEKKHTLYTEGTEDSAKVLIASSPGEKYTEFLEKYPSSSEKTEALALAEKIEKRRSKNLTAAEKIDEDNEKLKGQLAQQSADLADVEVRVCSSARA